MKREKHTGVPILANCRVLPPLGLLMHGEAGSLICKQASLGSGRMPLAGLADTCQQEETLVSLPPFFSVRVLTSGGLLVKEEISVPSLALGNQGTLGKFHNFTESQPLYKTGTS